MFTTTFKALVATTIATGLLTAAAPAKTVTFGIRLDHEPSNSLPAHNCREDGSEEPTPTCTRVALDGGRVVKAGARAPADGVITKFRIRSGGPGVVTFRLARLRIDDLATDDYFGLGAGRGPTVMVAGNGFAETGNPVETFRTRTPVRKGDYLGIDSAETSALYCSGGGDAQAIFATPLRRSTPTPAATTDGCELLIQAVMRIKPTR